MKYKMPTHMKCEECGSKVILSGYYRPRGAVWRKLKCNECGHIKSKGIRVK